MGWNPFRAKQVLAAGRKARLLHSAWLTRAVREDRVYPRIPARRVDEGGFAELLSTQEGRVVVDWWWEHTLSQVDDLKRIPLK